MTFRTHNSVILYPFDKTGRLLFFQVLLLSIWGCTVNVIPGVMLGNWHFRSAFEGPGRTSAVGFTIGNQAFVGTGLNINKETLTDFWSYDPLRNAWAQETAFPGVARSGAVGFSVYDKGYVGLGADVKGNRLNDFYAYTPATKSWRRIADFGGTARLSAIGFSINNQGYVGFGDDLTNARDLWTYSPVLNTWQKMATYAGTSRVGAVAIVLNGLGYIGTGTNQGVDLTDWWAYDPINDRWVRKQDFPAKQSATIQGHGGVGFDINGKGYLAQSNESDITWEYDPTADTWTQRGTFKGGNRQNGVGFSLGTKGYLTTGGAAGEASDNLLEYDPAVP